jgi:hypothetical protein
VVVVNLLSGALNFSRRPTHVVELKARTETVRGSLRTPRISRAGLGSDVNLRWRLRAHWQAIGSIPNIVREQLTNPAQILPTFPKEMTLLTCLTGSRD